MNAKIGVVGDDDEEEDDEGKKDEEIKEIKGMNREKEESIEKVDEIEDFNLNSFDGESENEVKGGGKELKDPKKDKEILGKNNGNITENDNTSPGGVRGDKKILEDKVNVKK